jgi:serpin B
MRSQRILPLFLTLAALGCSSLGREQPRTSNLPGDAPPAVVEAYRQGTPVVPALVSAHNGLGLALFQQLRQTAPAANLTISPLSIAQCLGMIYNGAGGQTRLAMAQTLGLADPAAAVLNPQNAALLASLYGADAGVTLQIANSVWARKSILPAFLACNQTYYGAQTGTLDGAPATVNAWVAQKTQGRIPALLEPTLDCSQLDAILVNAIYFKGSWTTPFAAGNTVARPFTRADGSIVSVPMMAQTTAASYRANALAEVARLPYGGGRYGMVILLPRSGVTLAALAAGLDPAAWGSLSQATLSITLPKFRTGWNGPLKAALSQLGMAIAFNPNLADFTGMADRDLYIDFIQHQTTVEVDETGTVASAGTGGGMAPTSAPMPATLTLDRPFLFAIQDSGTGEILFLGQMMDPAAGP